MDFKNISQRTFPHAALPQCCFAANVPGLSKREPGTFGNVPIFFRIFFKDIKMEHSLFALPFAYLGLFLAERGWPSFFLFFWVSVTMVSFRTFAMAVNRLIDRPIDSQNPRTLSRALPQSQLTSNFVLTASLVSISIFLWSAWKLGRLCFLLSPVPIFLAVLYPYLKRFTWLSHGVLGIILGISPYWAWLASRNQFSWIPGFLFAGVASWVAGFDIVYALQDLDFDSKFGLKSVPVFLGERPALWIAAGLHAFSVLAWAAAGALAGLGWIYAIGLVAVGLFLAREHWLVHRFGLSKINQAFFTMNAWVSVIVFLFAVVDLFVGATGPVAPTMG